jgi:hypothetical protein
MPPKKLTPNGQAAKPAGNKAIPVKNTATKAKAAPKSNGSATKYIRNVRGVEIRVTFDTGRKIHLSPRGQRNDMVAVSKDELEDPIFLNNLGSLYEVISSADAAKIRESQMTNASTLNSPRPEDIIKNEFGNDTQFGGVEPSNAEISIPVGTLVEKETRYTKGPEVTRSIAPEKVDVPGSAN